MEKILTGITFYFCLPIFIISFLILFISIFVSKRDDVSYLSYFTNIFKYGLFWYFTKPEYYYKKYFANKFLLIYFIGIFTLLMPCFFSLLIFNWQDTIREIKGIEKLCHFLFIMSWLFFVFSNFALKRTDLPFSKTFFFSEGIEQYGLFWQFKKPEIYYQKWYAKYSMIPWFVGIIVCFVGLISSLNK